jgi:hypothetical protein
MGGKIIEIVNDRVKKLRAIQRIIQMDKFKKLTIKDESLVELIDAFDLEALQNLIKKDEKTFIYSMGIRELREIAPLYSVSGYSRMSKEDLRDCILKLDAESSFKKDELFEQIKALLSKMEAMFIEFEIQMSTFDIVVDVKNIPIHYFKIAYGWLLTIEELIFKNYKSIKSLLTPDQWAMYKVMFEDEMNGFREVKMLNECKRNLRRSVFTSRPSLFKKTEMEMYKNNESVKTTVTQATGKETTAKNQ